MVVAGIVFALFAYVALPITAAYSYVTYRAPVRYFLKSKSHVLRAGISGVSPNGKYVVWETVYSGWSWPGRCVLLVVDSGRTEWLTRSRRSVTCDWARLWSPSGNQFVLEVGDWLNPIGLETAEPESFVVDARSGAKHSFAELCPGLKTMPLLTYPKPIAAIGWYSENIFAIRDAHDILFADVKSHKVRRCVMPREFTGEEINPYAYFRAAITERGIFMAKLERADSGMRVLRFAPDLSEAEIVVLPGIRDTGWISCASRDGRQFIIGVQVPNPNEGKGIYYREWYMVRLQDGVQLELLESEKQNFNGLTTQSIIYLT
jgi:hypothetical protein